jgi:transposase
MTCPWCGEMMVAADVSLMLFECSHCHEVYDRHGNLVKHARLPA